MSKKSANDYCFMVAGWMVTKLGLKGNALLVYAYIYEFTQDGSCTYHAGVKNLADALGIHTNSASKILADLVERGLLIKEVEMLNGWNLEVHYKAVRN